MHALSSSGEFHSCTTAKDNHWSIVLTFKFEMKNTFMSIQIFFMLKCTPLNSTRLKGRSVEQQQPQ
jgi:hypothetical protein